jgi:hypothetical protein
MRTLVNRSCTYEELDGLLAQYAEYVGSRLVTAGGAA